MVTIETKLPRSEAGAAAAGPGSTILSAAVIDADVERRTPAGPAPSKPRRPRRAIDDLSRMFGGRRTAYAATFGVIITALWLTLFTVGLSIPTAPYRDRLLNLANPAGPAGPAAAYGIFESLVVIAFAFTPTNLALLCMVSALAGCLGRLATTDDRAAELARRSVHRVTVEHTDTQSPPAGATTATESTTVQATAQTIFISPLAPAITAVTWGFFIYLIIISGTVVLTGDPFKETSPDQYLRLAGSASLLAFAVGWQPQILAQLVGNVGAAKLLKSS